MLKKIYLIIITVVFLFGASSVLAFPSEVVPPQNFHTVYGFVYSPDKKPVEEAKVTITNIKTGEILSANPTASDGSWTENLANLKKGYNKGDKLKIEGEYQENSAEINAVIGEKSPQKVDDIVLTLVKTTAEAGTTRAKNIFNWFWWILGTALMAGIIFYFLKKLKTKQ